MNPAYLEALRKIAQPIRAAEMPRSLTPMRRLLAALGDPQIQFPSVVVTGSVGKGTTCHQIARLLYTPDPYAKTQVSALKVGLYTGPHLHSFRERFVINGQMITQDEFVEAANTVFEAISQLDFAYSTFEMATTLALYWFAHRKVNIAVLEVGIGGRWDAVNVVENILAVFTPIEREHVIMLGGSLQTIAWNKAGIIQPNGCAISVIQQPIVEDILHHEAEQKQATRLFIEEENFVRVVYYNLMMREIIPKRDLAEYQPPIYLPGRLEAAYVPGQRLLIDGGHTPTSAQRLIDKIWQMTNSRYVYLIIGMLRDKSAHEFMAVFDSFPFHITLTTAPGHRALPPHELAQQANLKYNAVEIIPDLDTALAQVYTATESLIVITGSLRMAAAARETFGLLTPEELTEAEATRAIFEGEDYLSRLNPL
jgi:dihydrofolate synthase / folylpolyglutamate synthase